MTPTSLVSILVLPGEVVSALQDIAPVNPMTGRRLSSEELVSLILGVVAENKSHPTIRHFFLSEEAVEGFVRGAHQGRRG